MYINIDHIALSSNDFAEHNGILKSLGYRLFFEEKNIPNLKIKKPLMIQFKKQQNLAFFVSKGNFNIELINNNPSGKKSYIIPVFERAIQKLPVDNNNINTNNIVKALKRYDSKNKVYKFNKIIVKSWNINNSLSFWQDLGFKTLEKDRTHVIMKFISMTDKEDYFIYLKRQKEKNIFHLDDQDLSCLAFLSSSIEEDKDYFQKIGLHVTEIENTKINNRQLSIFFVVGPSGELVEIIGL